MTFEFHPLRFEFRATESLFFPPGKAANILRGALGLVFRQIACVPHCSDARTCSARDSCYYARIFEPVAQDGGPSGLADSPRPFVFRARHLDGRTVQPSESFYFDLHLFSLDPTVLTYFILAFAALGREGLGPRRGRAELRRVLRLPFQALPEQVVYEHTERMIAGSVEPVSLDLTPSAATRQIRVAFLSPTELKHEHQVANRPEFPILFGRIRDRIGILSRLYGARPLDIDFLGSNTRAAAVRMTFCEVRRQEFERQSSRTGRAHSIGGFVGIAEYEGDLGEFVPYLEAARWVGVGRQVVWGKGEIAISCQPCEDQVRSPE